MRTLAIQALLITLIVTPCFLRAGNASARVFVGGGVVIGSPYYYYPPYYSYYPPYPYAPEYPYPYGAPPAPAYSYQQPPQPSAEDRYYSEDNGEYCREYRHSALINGQQRQVFGHACRQPDGSWRMVD